MGALYLKELKREPESLRASLTAKSWEGFLTLSMGARPDLGALVQLNITSCHGLPEIPADRDSEICILELTQLPEVCFLTLDPPRSLSGPQILSLSLNVVAWAESVFSKMHCELKSHGELLKTRTLKVNPACCLRSSTHTSPEISNASVNYAWIIWLQNHHLL